MGSEGCRSGDGHDKDKGRCMSLLIWTAMTRSDVVDPVLFLLFLDILHDYQH